MKAKWKTLLSEIVTELVDSAVEKGAETLANAWSQRRAGAEASKSETPEETETPEAPGFDGVARGLCPECSRGTVFWKLRPPDLVYYWCRHAGCGWSETVGRQRASNREGVPI